MNVSYGRKPRRLEPVAHWCEACDTGRHALPVGKPHCWYCGRPLREGSWHTKFRSDSEPSGATFPPTGDVEVFG